MSLKEKLHTGHLKALLIALPATIVYGFFIFLALDISIGSLFQGRHILSSTLLLLSALASSAGIFGAWLAFVFQRRLDSSYTKLNQITSKLLGFGILGAVLGVITTFWFVLPLSNAFAALTFFFVPIFLSIYALNIIIRVSHRGQWSKD